MMISECIEQRVFLTAQWKYLAMLNYEVEPELLGRYLPAGTELDAFEGRTYVSMVGFRFLDTRVLGLALPWHRNFEEINLRFYVRCKARDGWRRGVVFIREIVPRRLIALVARLVYQEDYVALPTASTIEFDAGRPQDPVRVVYRWNSSGLCERFEQAGVSLPGRSMKMPETGRFHARRTAGGGCATHDSSNRITAGGGCATHDSIERISAGGGCDTHESTERITAGGGCATHDSIERISAGGGCATHETITRNTAGGGCATHESIERITAGGGCATAVHTDSGAGWNTLSLECAGAPAAPAAGSAAEFITEHYWGYTKLRDGRTAQYRVTHPPWRVWGARRAQLQGDAAALYGAELGQVLAREPASAFLAEGSAVTVSRGNYI